jgi:DNA-directed RNA polymerase specialized sigma subunit
MIGRRPCPDRFKRVDRTKKRAGTIAACATNLAAQLGRTATDDEVASMLAMSVTKLRALHKA